MSIPFWVMRKVEHKERKSDIYALFANCCLLGFVFSKKIYQLDRFKQIKLCSDKSLDLKMIKISVFEVHKTMLWK